jgi:hypothetical protein
MADVTVPTSQVCDECGKTFTRDFNVTGFWHHLCPDCLAKLRERSRDRDCAFCSGKGTVHATYHFESDYGEPYICHTCMKDTNGATWGFIPSTVAEIYFEGSPLDLDEPTLRQCPYCQHYHEPQLIDACPLKPKHGNGTIVT